MIQKTYILDTNVYGELLIELFESLSDEIITVILLSRHLAEDYFKKYKELSKSTFFLFILLIIM